MGFASFSGPIRVGTVRTTTGTTPGVVRNTGLPVLTQSVSVPFGAVKLSPSAVNLCVVPAGCEILRVTAAVTTNFTAATAIAVQIGNPATAAAYVASFNVTTVTAGGFAASPAGATGARNVGLTDVQVTGTFTATGADATAGALSIIIEYIQRADDGSQNPANP